MGSWSVKAKGLARTAASRCSSPLCEQFAWNEEPGPTKSGGVLRLESLGLGFRA